jgi:plasmid stability protein
MGQIIVRNLEDALIDRLKARARSKGQSLEQTVREVLAEAAPPNRDVLLAFAAEMRARTAKRKPDLDVVAAIREDRDTDHGREWP